MKQAVVTYLAAVMFLIGAGTSAVLAGEAPRDLIQRLGGEAINLAANEGASEAQRLAGFERLFQKGFDVPLVSRIVLGRYWRAATPEQQEAFISVFHKYMVATYADRLNAYSGQTFEITGDQPLSEQETLVKSVVKQPNGPSFKVDWRVLTRNEESRIVDVIVEGVSMAITHRSEFSSIISQTGNIEALLERLNNQVNKG